MPTPVAIEPVGGQTFRKYARLVSLRGYVHNSLGNMAVRVPHPDYPHGVTYTKHAGVSLEEMELDNIVITDIPTSRILCGEGMTSIGHNLNREILRLRPEVNATIHVHDDLTIAYFASGAFDELRMISIELPFVLAKPVHCVPAHINVEVDVAGVGDFIHNTNSVVMLGHGITTLGRSLSEAYHRLNALTSEIRRNVAAEMLAALKGTTPCYRSQAEIETMYQFAESVIYPTRAEQVMAESA